MGVKLLYPRRRSLILKMFMFCTVLGFVGLWYKNEDPEINSPSDLMPRKEQQEGPNHIPDLDKTEFHNPPDPIDHQLDPILPIKNRLEQLPGEEVGIPAPILQPINLQPPVDNNRVNLPNAIDEVQRMRASLWFLEDDRKVVKGLGEGGKLVKLSGEEGKIADEVMKKEAFNLILSDKISVNRTVPDSRDPL